ncbi:MAG: methyltransferase domain-containing protein [Alphaproteobacteria bacterium]|jgi:ubiquinone/menaquinone biosynthesis C-methylase UbiE|nr:methyltransferase domain-containing protein [Alphaproteobacteria bacterium]
MSANIRPDQSFQAAAFNGFIHGLKGVWREELYSNVVAEARETDANDVPELERAMAGSAQYEMYAWLERFTQQMSLVARWGAYNDLEPQMKKLSAQLDAAAAQHPERLNLDPALPLPSYLTEQETHQYLGGLWESDIGGYTLERLTEKASFSLNSPERPLSWYAEFLRDTLKPSRILDLGCARARGTRALKRAMPDTEIHGCDLCGPLLRLAHLRNIEEDLAITLWQRNAEDTNFDAANFDLVTSHWLIHEMPPAAIRNMIAEGWRLLQPGGTFAMYDMYLTPGGLIGEWLHAGYAARNNEPFAYSITNMDLKADLEAVGFTDVQVELSQLQATPEALRGELPDGRLHYMSVITGRKPA